MQAVGDIKDFTYYPPELQPAFQRFRAPWIYMNATERKKPEFQRPKRWFPKKQYEKTKKLKVFSMTTSTGKQLTFVIPTPWDQHAWAKFVKSKVAPFLKRSFPNKSSFTILLDGEKIMHAPPGKAVMKAAGISVLPGWPPHSPELNPQEHVWTQAEPKLRELETGKDSFEAWKPKVLKAVALYPSPEKLVGSMAKRCKDCIDRDGAMLDC